MTNRPASAGFSFIDVITLPHIEEVSNPGPGPKTIGVYQIIKRHSLVVVARLSPEFTARIVDRWKDTASERGTRSRFCPRRAVRLCKHALQGRWGAFHGSRPKQQNDCSTDASSEPERPIQGGEIDRRGLRLQMQVVRRQHFIEIVSKIDRRLTHNPAAYNKRILSNEQSVFSDSRNCPRV